MTSDPDTSPPGWARSWISSLVREEARSFTAVRSQEVNRVYRLEFDRQSLFLKVGPGLQREYHKLQWLDGRLPCPRPVGFTTHLQMDALLMSAVEGEDLACLSAQWAPQVIVSRLANALIDLHRTDTTEWPFGAIGEGKVLVHGDACLPNVLFQGIRLSGYIDLGDMAVAEPEVDLAAAIWSLQYNLGPGYGLPFLRQYGWNDADEDIVEALRRRYEQA